MQTKQNSASELVSKRWEDNALYNTDEVLERCGVSKTTLYTAIRRGHFPKPIKIGLRRSAWLGKPLNRYDELIFSGALSTEEGKEKLRAEFA